jgi:hypothetical protein
MDPLTIMLISAGIQGLSAGVKNVRANRGLKELEKQRLPSYMDAAAPIQENKQMYAQMAKTGMGPASLNLARNQFAAGQNALTAAPAGGQLRSQIGRLASANAGGFANQLAGQNEAIRRQAMGGVAQANLGISGLQQRDVGAALQRRNQAEAAYGQAIQDSRREALGAVQGLATGMIAQQNFNKQLDLYNNMYGRRSMPNISNNTYNPINPAGTFALAGPQTFDQYLQAGMPAGTSQTPFASYSPDFVTPTPSPYSFAAPSANPTFSPFQTPNAMFNRLPSGAGLQPANFSSPGFNSSFNPYIPFGSSYSVPGAGMYGPNFIETKG